MKINDIKQGDLIVFSSFLSQTGVWIQINDVIHLSDNSKYFRLCMNILYMCVSNTEKFLQIIDISSKDHTTYSCFKQDLDYHIRCYGIDFCLV